MRRLKSVADRSNLKSRDHGLGHYLFSLVLALAWPPRFSSLLHLLSILRPPCYPPNFRAIGQYWWPTLSTSWAHCALWLSSNIHSSSQEARYRVWANPLCFVFQHLSQIYRLYCHSWRQIGESWLRVRAWASCRRSCCIRRPQKTRSHLRLWSLSCPNCQAYYLLRKAS